jgi:uncharacterized membrane protein (UPF0136 family)
VSNFISLISGVIRFHVLATAAWLLSQAETPRAEAAAGALLWALPLLSLLALFGRQRVKSPGF